MRERPTVVERLAERIDARRSAPEPRCPVCHEPQSLNRCRVSVDSQEHGEWYRATHVHIHCHHPETHVMLARARRYKHIGTPGDEPTRRET